MRSMVEGAGETHRSWRPGARTLRQDSTKCAIIENQFPDIARAVAPSTAFDGPLPRKRGRSYGIAADDLPQPFPNCYCPPD